MLRLRYDSHTEILHILGLFLAERSACNDYELQ